MSIEHYNPEMVGAGIGFAISAIIKDSNDVNSRITIALSLGCVTAALYADIKTYIVGRLAKKQIDGQEFSLEEINDLNTRRRFMRPSEEPGSQNL